MSVDTVQIEAASLQVTAPRPTRLVAQVLRSGEGRLGAALFAVVLAVVIVGPLLAPYSPTAIAVGPPLAGPSSVHPFGTDELGRDVLSRVLSGGGSVVVVPLVAVVLTLLVGVSLGMLAGYLGGRVDAVIARALDVLLSVPPLLVVLVIAASFGTSDVVLVVALVLVSVPKEARVIRGATQDLRTREFVEAAQARGERTRWVLVRELMPNLAPTLLVEVAMRFTFTVIFVATLNFLGLGVQPPNPNWGLMVSEGRDYISQAPLMTLGPVFAIAMLVIAVNLLSDALNTALATRSEAR